MRKFRNKQIVIDALMASSHRVQKKIVLSVISMLLVLFGAVYVALSLYEYNGSFTVSVDMQDKGAQYSLILSEDVNFTSPAPQIMARTIPDIVNIAEETLPDDLDSIGGQHNGENYFAYTFFIMNNGEDSCSYNYQINIDQVKKNVDKGIRLRLYKNGVYENFARTRTDGKGPEKNTTEFLTIKTVTQGKRDNFGVGDVDRYTIVLWIEGNDPDTTDDLIGGTIKFNMDFTVE